MPYESAADDGRVVLERRKPGAFRQVGCRHDDLGVEDRLTRSREIGRSIFPPDAHSGHAPPVRAGLHLEVERLARIRGTLIAVPDGDDGQVQSAGTHEIPCAEVQGDQGSCDDTNGRHDFPVQHSFLLSVNRVQGDRGAAVPAAVSHSSTQFREDKADHQTSTLAAVQASREETGPLLPARDDHQPDDDLRRWFNAGWPVRRSLVSHRQPRARKDGAA